MFSRAEVKVNKILGIPNRSHSIKLNADMHKTEILTQSRASSNVHDSEDYQAPAINVIEDKTYFSVAKHIRGIKQEGFDFESTSKPINKTEKEVPLKQNTSSAGIKDSNTSKNNQSKNKMTEDEYIQLLLNKSVLDKGTKESNKNQNSNDVKAKNNQQPHSHRKVKLQKQQTTGNKTQNSLKGKASKNIRIVKPGQINKTCHPEEEVKLKLPPVSKSRGNKVKQNRSHSTKKWVTNMPPTLGYNANVNTAELPEYNEKEFLVYAVFREKILDKVLREHLKDSIQQTIEAQQKIKEQQAINNQVKLQEKSKDRYASNSQAQYKFDIGETNPEIQVNVSAFVKWRIADT